MYSDNPCEDSLHGGHHQGTVHIRFRGLVVRPHLTIAVRRGRDTMLEDLLTGSLRKKRRLEKGSSDANLNITPSPQVVRLEL